MLELTWRGTEHLQRRAQIYFSEKNEIKVGFGEVKENFFEYPFLIITL